MRETDGDAASLRRGGSGCAEARKVESNKNSAKANNVGGLPQCSGLSRPRARRWLPAAAESANNTMDKVCTPISRILPAATASEHNSANGLIESWDERAGRDIGTQS